MACPFGQSVRCHVSSNKLRAFGFPTVPMQFEWCAQPGTSTQDRWMHSVFSVPACARSPIRSPQSGMPTKSGVYVAGREPGILSSTHAPACHFHFSPTLQPLRPTMPTWQPSGPVSTWTLPTATGAALQAVARAGERQGAQLITCPR